MCVINLTQHKATAEQVAAGVVDLDGEMREELVTCLTFNEMPNEWDIRSRVTGMLTLLECFDRPEKVMIGGAPWLMAPLIQRLIEEGYVPLFAFSVRESIEQTMPDGSVRKTAVFRHKGFVTAFL